MLVFDIKTADAKLPSSARWLQPNYFGLGDSMIRPERDNPEGWKEKFPEFDWNLSGLDDLRKRLVECLGKIDPIVSQTKFKTVNAALNPLGLLTHGIVLKEYGGELCNINWLKMIELSSLLKPLFQYTEQKRIRDITTLHLNETSGDSIVALNHILKTNYAVDWSWRVVGLDKNITCNYPKNIMNTFGGDMDSESNCRRIAFNLSATRIDLVTSMTQHKDSAASMFGTLLTALATLDKAGAVVLKWHGILDHYHISWLWLMNCVFKELLLVKPESSDATSDEIYVVGLEYKSIKEEYIESIYPYLRFINSIDQGCPALFRKLDIPEEFIRKIVEAQRILITKQCESIDQKYDSWMHYKNFTHSQIQEALSAEHLYISKAWLERTGLRVLSKNDTLGISI